MIRVENAYDFTVEELTDILENTPIAVDMSTNEAVAEYIIQALNINSIVKKSLVMETTVDQKTTKGSPDVNQTKTDGSKKVYHKNAPYYIRIERNKDGKRLFECDARTIAFFAYDPFAGKPHKAILSEQKPTATDIANVCELLGEINGWGTMQ